MSDRRTISEAMRPALETWNAPAIAEEMRALKRTRRMIADEACWQNMLDCWSDAGNIVVPWSRRATCWSLAAAMVVHQRHLNNLWWDTEDNAVVRLIGGKSFWDVVVWGESSERTHEEVMQLLDDSIAMLALEYAEAITLPLFGSAA